MAGAVASSKKGAVSKLCFPYMQERMKTKITISTEFKSMIKGHGLNRSYLHRFLIIPNSTCPCELEEQQIFKNVILNCTQLEKVGKSLRNAIARTCEPGHPRWNNSREKVLGSS